MDGFQGTKRKASLLVRLAKSRLAVTGGSDVKVIIKGLAIAGILALGACDSKKENAIENAAENQADMMENQAETMEDQADVTNNAAAANAMENQADVLEEKAEQTREQGEKAADKAEETAPR